MRFRSGNVLRIEPMIKIYGCIDVFHNFCWSGSVAATPHGIASHDSEKGAFELSKCQNNILFFVICAILICVLLLQTALADKRLQRTVEFTVTENGSPAPLQPVFDVSGLEVKLSDFKGKVILVNFWATWCRPCVKEMPSLEQLQLKFNGKDFAVVAVNEDREGLKIAKPFLDEIGSRNLKVYADPNMALMRAFGVRGLPTSFLIDRRGLIIGKIEGILEWNTPEVWGLIDYYLQ